MAERNPTYYDPGKQTISPIPTGDTITTSTLPLSTRAGNQISIQDGGLYAGRALRLLTAYVSTSAGVDAPGRGTQAAPYKTLDYACSDLVSNNTLASDLTLLLKAGETFATANRLQLAGGNLTIAWYGDPLYGDYPGNLIGSADPSVMLDLTRPRIIPTGSNTTGQWRLGGLDFNVTNSSLYLAGVIVQMPGAPNGNQPVDAYSIYSDYIEFKNRSCGQLNTYGCLIDKADSSPFGFLGIHARAAQPTFTEYASQFLVNGQKVADSSATVDQLAARQWFIKFYPDFAGANQQSTSISGTSLTSSPGSSVLSLMWSETNSQIVTGTRTNVGSFPMRFDPAYGLRNYFTNLIRDQQQRPLNVVSGFLF